MGVSVQRNYFDHVALFAEEKPKELFKLVSNVGSWIDYAGVTQGVHPLAKAAGTVAGAFEVPLVVTNLHALVKTANGEGIKPGTDFARQITADFSSFCESCAKAVKWVLGFFKDSVTAPWAALASGFGMYNCADLGLRQVKDLTSECNKPVSEQNTSLITQKVCDIAKFVFGFALNALSFAGIVAGVVVASPVMLSLSSAAIVCTFAAFFFKQEANNVRV